MAGNPKSNKHVAFVVYPRITLLEMVAARSVLGSILMMSGYRPVVVAKNVEVMESDTSLAFIPQKCFVEIPDPAVLFVVGGPGALEVIEDEASLAYVRDAAEKAVSVAATGTGSLILAAAGLLKGRQAATHWTCAEKLEKYGACYAPRDWIEDGKFITGAGVSAAVDLSLYLGARLGGKRLARMTQLLSEYNPEPPYGGIDWSQIAQPGAQKEPTAQTEILH